MTTDDNFELLTPENFEEMLSTEHGLKKLESMFDETSEQILSHFKTGVPTQNKKEESLRPNLFEKEDKESFDIDDLIPIQKSKPKSKQKSDESYTPPPSTVHQTPTSTVQAHVGHDEHITPSTVTQKNTTILGEKGHAIKGLPTKKPKKKVVNATQKETHFTQESETSERDTKKRKTIDQQRLEEGLKSREARVQDLFNDKGNVT